MSDKLDLTLLKNCLKYPKLLGLMSENNLWFLLSQANKALESKKGKTNFIKKVLNMLSFVERLFVLFLDNSKSNLEGLTRTKHVIPIKIEGTKYFSKLCRIEKFNRERNLPGSTFPIYDSTVSYLNKLPLKSRNLGWFIWLRNKEISAFDELSGLREHHLTLCRNGILNGYVKTLIFDWDRTLTNFEGILTYKSSSLTDINNLLNKRRTEFNLIAEEKGLRKYKTPDNIELKDIATLYFGDNYTKNKLQNLWTLTRAYDVKVYILTANPAAKKKAKTRNFFFSLLKETGLELPEKSLICSQDYKGNKQWIIKNVLKIL